MKSYRLERIERLMYELEYEVTRGILEREVDETITFEFYIPFSQCIPNGLVKCTFQTRPVTVYSMPVNPPKLRLIEK